LIRYTLILFVLIFSCVAYAQPKVDAKSVRVETDQPLLEFLSSIEAQSAIRFFYMDEWLSPFTIKSTLSGLSLKEILLTTLGESEINVIFLNDYSVIFFKDPYHELERDAIIESAITKKIKVDNITLGSPKTNTNGSNVNLKGVVKDKESQAPIAGATVYVNGLNISSQTDSKGQYQLTIPGGEYVVSFRYVTYEERLLVVNIYESGEVDIEMDEVPITLDEVIITDQSIVDKRVGQTSIKMINISRSPSFLGEMDVIKTLQIQSGVSTVSEVSTGFNVRGGGVDQNLVLYDGVPIFNTSHALGFFSSFNSEAIKETSFYKGGIPAEYGGRVSSVLSMTSKEGNYQNWHGNFGIGFVSSNFTIGGPIKKDTSSLHISLRSTYSDWILNFLKKGYKNIEQSSVSFYDGSIKYAQKLKNGGKLTLSSYSSSDQFQLASDSINHWQNLALGVRYDNNLRNNYYYSIGIYAGRYAYKVSEMDPATAFDLSYSVFYPSLKLDINKDGIHKQSFGFQSTFYNFKPGDLKPISEQSNSKQITMPDERSIESAIYYSDSFNWKERFNIDAGLRLSLYNRIGPGLVFNYQQGAPLEPRNVVDSTQYGSGEMMKTYGGAEPRLSLRYAISRQSSVKLGYNRILQYIHLVSNTAAVTPVDIWQSSNTYFRPQVADQISLGYFRNSKEGIWQGFVEGFYKYTQNILDFKDGANLILNPKLETALLGGIGTAYGIEFSVSKTKGKLEAEINYTYSRSFRQVNGEFDVEKINNGNRYPSNYDQPHIVNFNWRYSMTRKIFFSGIFTYRTGRPISIPLTAYEISGSPITDFSDRNNYRLADYHRLDLALVIEGDNKKNKHVKGQWAFSIYNVYGRRNPYSAYFVYNKGGDVKSYQISLIGVAVPSITYGIKF
jgi:hypothetical protein